MPFLFNVIGYGNMVYTVLRRRLMDAKWHYKRIRKREKFVIINWVLIAVLPTISSIGQGECNYPPKNDPMFKMVDVVSKEVKPVLQYDDKVHVICKDTYDDIGEISFACNGQNTYRYSKPWCREAYCPAPEAPLHGNLQPEAVSYPAKSQINITCAQGYSYSRNPTITCQRDRQWTETVGTCKKIECPAIRRPHSTLKTQPPYYYNASLPVRCKEGHYYTGDESATCGYDSQWTRPIGFCKRVTCNWPHTTIKNGSIRECRPCHYRDQLQISCDEGYKYTDPPIMCGQDGSWNTSRIGSCEPVGCGKLPSVRFGDVRRVNASVTIVSCMDSAYIELEGHNTIYCDTNGSWTQLPTCKPVWNGPQTWVAAVVALLVAVVVLLIVMSIRQRRMSFQPNDSRLLSTQVEKGEAPDVGIEKPKVTTPLVEGTAS